LAKKKPQSEPEDGKRSPVETYLISVAADFREHLFRGALAAFGSAFHVTVNSALVCSPAKTNCRRASRRI